MMPISVSYLCFIGLFLGYSQALITDEKEAEIFLRDYEPKSLAQYRKEVIAEWNYDADLTKENEKIMVSLSIS